MSQIILKNITMTLEPDSIQKAIDDVQGLTLDLKQALDALCERLLKDGVNIARINLHKYGIKGGSLLGRGIRYEMADGTSGKGYLLAGYPNDHMSDNPKWANFSYAVFVEFGFGTGNYYDKSGQRITSSKRKQALEAKGQIGMSTGRTSDHPSQKGVYRKATDFNLIESRYKPGQGFRGWVYKNRWDGKFYTSQGQPPKPFMYDTLMTLTEKAEKDGGRIVAEYLP